MMTIDERRDSPRIPIFLGVRLADGQQAFQQTQGTVSLGGVDFVVPQHGPSDPVIEVLLPAGRSRIRLTAKAIADRPERDHRRISASFVGLDVHTELLLARWLQQVSGNKPPTRS